LQQTMKNLLFSINIVLPLAILLAMGYLFKKQGLFTDSFIKAGNKLCFYVLLSCSLFKNLYDSVLDEIPYKLIIFVVVSIFMEFVLGIFFARAISDRKNQEGVIVQGVFRSNYAYIGIPLSTMMFTESQLITDTSNEISIITIFVIPLFNTLAVMALTYMNEHKSGENLLVTSLKNLAKNPCIISVSLGILVLLFRMAVPSAGFFIKNNLGFLYKVLGYLASMSTPFALLMVGAGLNFSHSLTNIRKLSLTVMVKNLIFPGFILLVAALMKIFTRVDFAVMISVFASPTAVASAVMASEMNGDGELANEIVVYTTMFSILSLVIIIYALKTAGCL